MGELQSVDVGAGAARFDPNMGDHHHFVCESCGAVRDVEISSTPKMRGVGAEGCEISEVGVVFHGKCGRCSQPSKRSPGQQAKKASNRN
jgi:Fe2+ or Zn2+ uptake regulation protein